MVRHSASQTAESGMTLIELLIALVVVVILAAVAWPSFQSAIQRSRRADGVAALIEIMQAQERWRANNPTYKASLTDPLLPGTRTTSSNGHYSLQIVADSASASRYTAQASVLTGSPQASDSGCQVLQVTVNGGNIIYSSLASGDTANAQPDPCWLR